MQTFIKALLMGLGACATSGCSSWTAETKVEESTYQAVSALDYVQSMQITQDPTHYHESSWLTAKVIGHQPSRAATTAWAAGRGALHAAITDQMEKHDASIWAKRAWQFISISYEAHAIRLNWQAGLRVTSIHHSPPTPVACEPSTTRTCL